MKWDGTSRNFYRASISCFNCVLSNIGMSKLLSEDSSVFLEDRIKQQIVFSGHIRSVSDMLVLEDIAYERSLSITNMQEFVALSMSFS